MQEGADEDIMAVSATDEDTTMVSTGCKHDGSEYTGGMLADENMSVVCVEDGVSTSW